MLGTEVLVYLRYLAEKVLTNSADPEEMPHISNCLISQLKHLL